MATINSLFEQAQLSQAAYASDLQKGMTGAAFPGYVTSLVNGGMSESQAIDFANTYTVVEQYTDPISGFSGTVFKGLDENGVQQTYMAIRGTEPSLTGLVMDAIADIGVFEGLNGQQQYEQLKTFYGSLISSGEILPGNLNVTGHSLGGLLAQMLAVDYAGDISETTTFNAPGLGGVGAQLFDLLGIVESNVPVANITNIRGEGFSPIATLGTLLGNVEEVYIEQSIDPVHNHSISTLTDSLAIYNLFASVDPSLDVDTITGILNAYNVDNTSVLETALAAVGGVYGESFQAFETDRNTFYTNLYDLGKVVSQGTIQSLAEASASEIEFAAREETAALYALVKMNPFAITGVDYSSRNQDGLLDLANYSDNYLEDRALFLYHTTHPDAPSPTAYDIKFQDTALGREASASNGTVDLTDDQHYIFGNLEGELIEGEGEEDHLYGMGGDDQIYGNGGNDYIEGGKGQDVLNGGAGDDLMIGGDGDYWAWRLAA